MTDIFDAIQRTAIRIKDAIDVKDIGYSQQENSSGETQLQLDIQCDMIIEEEFSMDEEDILVLYTDGVIEAKNRFGEQWDMDRLEEAITKSAHLTATKIKQNIIDTVMKWMDYQADDITLVVIKKNKNIIYHTESTDNQA